LPTSDENRWERNLKSLDRRVQQPSNWCGRSEQILLTHGGCEARKIPAAGKVFFLDFPFYRTYQALALLSSVTTERKRYKWSSSSMQLTARVWRCLNEIAPPRQLDRYALKKRACERVINKVNSP
jgi:hypothetical protein